MLGFEKKTDGNGWDWIGFICPGCGITHMVPVTGPKKWEWNQSMDNPTLSPSLKVTHPYMDKKIEICHFFLRNGICEFLMDCTHENRGKKLEVLNKEVV